MFQSKSFHLRVRHQLGGHFGCTCRECSLHRKHPLKVNVKAAKKRERRLVKAYVESTLEEYVESTLEEYVESTMMDHASLDDAAQE